MIFELNEIESDRKTTAKSPPVGAAFLLSQVGAHAAIGFAERLGALHLKVYDAGILRILGSNPEVTQQALSAMLAMFPSRLAALLDGLEKRKLIERRDSPTDRRIYRLRLTRAGRTALTAIGRVTRQLEDDLFAALSAREKKDLFDMLPRMVAQQRITPGVHPAYRQIGNVRRSHRVTGESMTENALHENGNHSPMRRRSGVIVKPCTNIENATTAKVMVMMSSRREFSGGSPKRQCYKDVQLLCRHGNDRFEQPENASSRRASGRYRSRQRTAPPPT
jgi:DNA-binding MarR family transcriptional regulator